MAAAVAAAMALALAGPPTGEAQRRDRRQQSGQPERPAALAAEAGLPDDQQIEATITEMLAAWQVGDINLLRPHYADDVTVVSGAFEPPVMGWANFARAFLRQHDRMQGMQLIRRNTVVRTQGKIGWATYQWEFRAVVDGAGMAAQGHTTLVMEKRGDRWVIVHNHTSVVPQSVVSAADSPGAANR